MTHEMMWNVHCARQTWAWATHVRVIECKSTRKCHVWGVLFTHPVGCSRFLSAVNDLTTTKKSCKVSLLSSLVKKPLNVSPRSMMPLFHGLRGAWLWWILWAPPGIVPLPPWCAGWRRRRMPFLILPRKESVQVALLQTHGEDGAILLMLRWSLIGVSSVHFCLICSVRYTISFCISHYASEDMR